MKESAVEWLVNELEKHYVKVDLKNTTVFLQAKEMEKQRAIEFAKHCLDKAKDLDIITVHSKAEQYYKETYKNK